MARALVTGAGGFVGANLVRALVDKGHDVHACVRPGGNLWRLRDIEKDITLRMVDMTSRDDVSSAVKEGNPELVYHLAHYGGNRGQQDGREIRRVIIEGAENLYEACQSIEGVSAIVNAGSSSEYGAQKDAMREDMLPEPNTEYGVAKVWATLYGEHLRRKKGIPITTLRLFSVYGPYEASIRFFPAVILSLLRNKLPTLANPKTVRDFVHVDDVVAAFMMAPQKVPGVYNIGTGVQTTLKDAVGAIQSALGSNEKLKWGGESGRGFDTQFWRADTTRAKKILGWESRISLTEGVKKTIEWFKTHKELYEK